MEAHETTDLVWTMTDVPFLIFNNVFRTQIAPEQLDARIDAALARAKSRNVPMSLWVGPTTVRIDIGAYLENKGFIRADDPPGMAVDLLSLNFDSPMPPDMVVEEVNDAETLVTWCQISSEVFRFPHFAIDAWAGIFASVPFGPGKAHRHYLSRLVGVPVGTSSVYYDAGVANVSSVARCPSSGERASAAQLLL